MMPKLDGFEVCRQLRADPGSRRAHHPRHRQGGYEGCRGRPGGRGDEYLTKPVDQAALLARVKSMLRIKALHDTAQEQGARLEAQADELAEWGRTLERRVAEQLAELDARQPLPALPVPSAGRHHRLLGRREAPRESSARNHGGVLRPPGLYRLRRDGGARGSHGGAPRVPRGDGRADLPPRGDARALRRGRPHGLLQRPGALSGPRRARRADGRRDAGACRGARSRVAQARLPTRIQRRDRARLRDPGEDRLRRAIRLRRDRHGDQPRRAALRCGAGRPDTRQPARLRGGGRTGGGRVRRRVGPQGVSQTHVGVQRRYGSRSRNDPYRR